VSVKGVICTVAVSLTAFTLTMAGWLTGNREYRYYAPDREAWISVDPVKGRAPKPGRPNRVRIAITEPGDPYHWAPYRIVELGQFDGRWRPSAIAWIDSRTANICPLARNAATARTVVVPLTATERRSFHITTDCPDFLKRSD
jgi:hypothetical protein